MGYDIVNVYRKTRRHIPENTTVHHSSRFRGDLPLFFKECPFCGITTLRTTTHLCGTNVFVNN